MQSRKQAQSASVSRPQDRRQSCVKYNDEQNGGWHIVGRAQTSSCQLQWAVGNLLIKPSDVRTATASN